MLTILGHFRKNYVPYLPGKTNEKRPARAETMPPLISVLIPTYQREHLVEETVQSALSQDYPEFEVVLVDNKSADNTYEIAKDIASSSPRLRVFQNDQNVGPVLNWLECVKRARGQYSKLLFSDDLLAPSYLSKTSEVLVNNPGAAFVFTSVNIGLESWSGGVYYRWRDRTEAGQASEYIEQSLGINVLPVSPGCALFRTEDLQDAILTGLENLPELRGHGAGPDLLVFLLTALKYPQVGYVDEPLCFFRDHPGSLTADGLGGAIVRSYDLAKIWFAENHKQPFKVESRLRFNAWLHGIERDRSLVSPTAYFQTSPASVAQLGYAITNAACDPVGLFKRMRSLVKRFSARASSA